MKYIKVTPRESAHTCWRGSRRELHPKTLRMHNTNIALPKLSLLTQNYVCRLPRS